MSVLQTTPNGYAIETSCAPDGSRVLDFYPPPDAPPPGSKRSAEGVVLRNRDARATCAPDGYPLHPTDDPADGAHFVRERGTFPSTGDGEGGVWKETGFLLMSAERARRRGAAVTARLYPRALLRPVLERGTKNLVGVEGLDSAEERVADLGARLADELGEGEGFLGHHSARVRSERCGSLAVAGLAAAMGAEALRSLTRDRTRLGGEDPSGAEARLHAGHERAVERFLRRAGGVGG